ncbi:MAG TPA: alcohol dehydrogenase catalytic domain-containing protein, partial [Bryobacteraceae bacterium]|nr:alcohol dehydrogenase catalytic domain-containing protein [Bryobacteraceae bacterium]
GICGSDLHNFKEGSIGNVPCSYPMVLGHEPTGTVVKTGGGVTGWSAGDRAALEPAVYCYHCEFCRAGRHNVCSNIRFFSMAPDPGFLREYANLPAENLVPLPPGVDLDTGTLFEPLAVALHSMKFAAPQSGERAVVFGAGPIGLLTIAALRLSGAARIWVVEPVAARRKLALAAGADAVLDPAESDPVRTLAAETGGRGMDMAIDCAAAGDSIGQAIHATRNAGRVVVTGIPAAAEVPVDFHVLRRKELALYNVRRSNHESETALEILAQAPRRFAALVTHARPLEGTESAFRMLAGYEDGVGKVIVRP